MYAFSRLNPKELLHFSFPNILLCIIILYTVQLYGAVRPSKLEFVQCEKFIFFRGVEGRRIAPPSRYDKAIIVGMHTINLGWNRTVVEIKIAKLYK